MKGTLGRLLGLSVLTLACSACDSQHDTKTEKALVNALVEHKNDQVMSIDLNTVLPKGWSKVCVQTPYMMPEMLEKASGTKVENFKMITDESNVYLWVFYGKDKPRYIDIPRSTTMEFRSPNVNGDVCTDTSNPEINMTFIKETKFFFFN